MTTAEALSVMVDLSSNSGPENRVRETAWEIYRRTQSHSRPIKEHVWVVTNVEIWVSRVVLMSDLCSRNDKDVIESHIWSRSVWTGMAHIGHIDVIVVGCGGAGTAVAAMSTVLGVWMDMAVGR